MAKVAGHLSKLVWVVAAGYLLAKLLLSGAVSAAGREPDSTSKLVQDALFEAYAAPLLVLGKLLLLSLAFGRWRLGWVSFPFPFARLSFAFSFAFVFVFASCLLLVMRVKLLAFPLFAAFAPLLFCLVLFTPSFVPHTVQAGLCLHIRVVKVLLKQAVKIMKATVAVKLQKHIMPDISFQTIHHRGKLDEVWKVLSRKLLISHHLLLPSIELLQERSWLSIKAGAHEARQKLEVRAPLASGVQQVELPLSFPAICGLYSTPDLKLGLPLGLLDEEVPKLSAFVLYLKLVPIKLEFEVELGLLVCFRGGFFVQSF